MAGRYKESFMYDSAHFRVRRTSTESNGYRVLIALDGPTGIALTRKHAIDAVVLDFNMPGMDAQ
jgi:CheY-like chemotaxis protein